MQILYLITYKDFNTKYDIHRKNITVILPKVDWQLHYKLSIRSKLEEGVNIYLYTPEEA